ncbi:MAG: hypothetical protein DIU76_06885 [Bacillota bacterium]|nr:MAG: hypothetical protein DIU76_06885 [Bacillota bacterium]
MQRTSRGGCAASSHPAPRGNPPGTAGPRPAPARPVGQDSGPGKGMAARSKRSRGRTGARARP